MHFQVTLGFAQEVLPKETELGWMLTFSPNSSPERTGNSVVTVTAAPHKKLTNLPKRWPNQKISSQTCGISANFSLA